MKKHWIIAALAVSIFSACQSQEAKEGNQEIATEESASANNPQTFGIMVKEESAMEMPVLLTKMDETDSIADLTVKGTVKEVCQMKGCWMTLRNESNANIRVKFKDYGFFVPKDISGKEVIIEGTALKEVLEEDEAKHYAEDGGKEYDPSMRNSISFVAHGVLVSKS